MHRHLKNHLIKWKKNEHLSIVYLINYHYQSNHAYCNTVISMFKSEFEKYGVVKL